MQLEGVPNLHQVSDTVRKEAGIKLREADRLTDLNAYWAEVSRCVKTGGFAGYRATTHPQGVLVAGTHDRCYPLAQALARWKQEFDDTKSGKKRASVTFRFSKRLGDESTAHETGIFLYTSTDKKGKETREYIHFEGLLRKVNGKWLMLMEYQKSKATEAEWRALKPSSRRFSGSDLPP